VRALLDTHAFIWWNSNDPRVSSGARIVIEDTGNEIFVSAVTAFEIATKYALGRLPLPEPPREYALKRMWNHGFQALAIDLAHGLHVASLPLLHRDPFDRLLVAQSQLEELPILTSDARIAAYGVEVIW
jgi:PIN domain nuclease of toxin-antitoxin system